MSLIHDDACPLSATFKKGPERRTSVAGDQHPQPK